MRFNMFRQASVWNVECHGMFLLSKSMQKSIRYSLRSGQQQKLQKFKNNSNNNKMKI